jgi:hypothetical protein
LGVRNIAGFESQCLTLGLPDEEGETILLTPTRPVPNGGHAPYRTAAGSSERDVLPR